MPSQRVLYNFMAISIAKQEPCDNYEKGTKFYWTKIDRLSLDLSIL